MASLATGGDLWMTAVRALRRGHAARPASFEVTLNMNGVENRVHGRLFRASPNSPNCAGLPCKHRSGTILSDNNAGFGRSRSPSSSVIEAQSRARSLTSLPNQDSYGITSPGRTTRPSCLVTDRHARFRPLAWTVSEAASLCINEPCSGSTAEEPLASFCRQCHSSIISARLTQFTRARPQDPGHEFEHWT
jgi:hypothetical protein